jgi:O-antigen/teichoic acid export membrane protein
MHDEQKADTSSVGTGIVMLGSVLIGLLLLTMVLAFIMTVYQAPHLSRLRDANVLVQIFANLVVAFYAFPAFTRTIRRAFLALGFAVLIFAYAAIFIVLTSAALTQTSRSQAQSYYAAIYASNIVALLLYAYGIVSLERTAKTSDHRSA